MTRVWAFVLCAFLLASCRNNANNVVLSSLSRSDQLSLLCGRVEQATGNQYRFFGAIPLDLCGDEFATIEQFPDARPQFLGSVTQTETGTVAVVNFSNGAIFDTSVTVPGVTALQVGEQPTSIQISPVDSRYTYVSSFSPKSVQAIPTREVITGSAEAPTYQPDAPELPSEQLRFDAAPTDIALHELATIDDVEEVDGQIVDFTTTVSYRYIYAAIPELGQVVQIQVNVDNATGEQTFGAVTELSLPTYDCDSVTPVPPPTSDDTDYNRICPRDFDDRGEGRVIKPVDTTTPCTSGPDTGPMPVSLAIDPGSELDLTDDVLLVADANQPVIHRFAVFANGATPIEPLVTLAPTLAIDTTPFVPATSDADDRNATQRYLYAVTADDSTILAIDYTPDSPTFGAVLPVIAGIGVRANEENIESRNRVRSVFSNARAIEVIAPFYELEEGPDGSLVIPESDEDTDICDPNDPDEFGLAQNSRNMRGVFLAVSLSNGTVYFLDVYDLNAPCRGGEGATACTLADTSSDRFASIRRNRRRWGFTPTEFITVDGTPSLQFNASPGIIDEGTGEPDDSGGPGLERIECPESQFGIFGANDIGGEAGTAPTGYLCGSSQVWSSFSQRWDARWGGLIPNSEGGLGLFSDESFDGEPGDWFLAGDVPFCRIGAIGEQTGTPEGLGLSVDELSAYGGDRIVITGELPPSTRDEPACEDFEDLLEDIDDRQVWFPIIRAFNDQLEIGPSPNPSRYTLEEVQACFNQFTEYQVHTRDVYTVTGTTSGFIHRVVPDESADDLCIFDPERPVDLPAAAGDPFDVDTYLTGRAFESATFINPLVSFEIQAFAEDVMPTDSTIALLSFGVLNQFVPDILDTSGGTFRSLPASLLFSAEQEQMFFVDFESGVRRIVFSPLSIVQSFE